MIQNLPPAPQVVRDTIAAVFRLEAYQHKPLSWWQRFLAWLNRRLQDLFDSTGDQAVVGNVLRILMILVVIVVAGRILYEFYLRYGGSWQRRKPRYAGHNEDPWVAADRLAAQGAYLEATHMVYAGVLASAADANRITLHESKTIGDYARELRPGISRDQFMQFRSFTRTYETLVYGVGACTADQYAALHADATRLIQDGWK